MAFSLRFELGPTRVGISITEEKGEVSLSWLDELALGRVGQTNASI
jgi:hypothetical protein